MPKIVSVILVITVLISCSSPQRKQLDLAQARKAIKAQNAKWFEAIKQYDIATLLSLYTDDATVMPPNFPMLKGNRQIKAYYERMSIRGVKISKGVMNTLELSGKDSTVYEIGQYIMDIERRDMPMISDTGKYNTIWKLQPDGMWRMYADCWNGNKPLRLQQANK